MRDHNAFRENVLAALERVGGDAALAEDPEAALWCVTRTLPSLLGNADAQQRLGALPSGAAPGAAAAAFLATADGQYHIIAAPVNFQPDQHHERVAITLGHPGRVAATRRGVMLADTSHHHSFVKILQTFRAGSAIQVPMLWKGDYLGVLICANAARATFEEIDYRAGETFARLAAALWVAHGGPKWLATLNYDRLAVRKPTAASDP
jgi:signal transduction protein with GAF and PtsI domain